MAGDTRLYGRIMHRLDRCRRFYSAYAEKLAQDRDKQRHRDSIAMLNGEAEDIQRLLREMEDRGLEPPEPDDPFDDPPGVERSED